MTGMFTPKDWVDEDIDPRQQVAFDQHVTDAFLPHQGQSPEVETMSNPNPLTADEINAARKAAAAPTPLPDTSAPGTQAAPESASNTGDDVQHGVGPDPDFHPE